MEDKQTGRPWFGGTWLYHTSYLHSAILPTNRQGFSHREADDKSLLDEVLRRGRGERGRLGWDGCCVKGGWNGWVAGVCGI